jgi:hypothetical protein
MILERITIKPEVAIQIEVVAMAECKTSLSIACSMKETLAIKQEIVPSF